MDSRASFNKFKKWFRDEDEITSPGRRTVGEVNLSSFLTVKTFLVSTLQRGNVYHTGFYSEEWEPDEKQHLQSVNQV